MSPRKRKTVCSVNACLRNTNQTNDLARYSSFSVLGEETGLLGSVPIITSSHMVSLVTFSLC